jgi:hypothetical protein
MTTHPCPVCGRPRKWYIRQSVRGPNTKSGKHHAGEQRNRRELRATCGRKLCRQIQRGRSLLAGQGGP